MKSSPQGHVAKVMQPAAPDLSTPHTPRPHWQCWTHLSALLFLNLPIFVLSPTSQHCLDTHLASHSGYVLTSTEIHWRVTKTLLKNLDVCFFVTTPQLLVKPCLQFRDGSGCCLEVFIHSTYSWWGFFCLWLQLLWPTTLCPYQRMYPPSRKDFISLTLNDPHSHAYNNGKHRRQSCWRVRHRLCGYNLQYCRIITHPSNIDMI